MQDCECLRDLPGVRPEIFICHFFLADINLQYLISHLSQDRFHPRFISGNIILNDL